MTYDLIAPLEMQPSPKLLAELAGEFKSTAPDRRTVRLGDVLGHSLAKTVVSSLAVPAVAAFCWDEMHALGNFRAPPPGVWLASRLEDQFSGEWKAEGYGFDTSGGCRVARWMAWDEPESEEHAHVAYKELSATHRMDEFMKTIDRLLVEKLVRRDPNALIAAAFVATVAVSKDDACELMIAAKEIIGDYLCSYLQ